MTTTTEHEHKKKTIIRHVLLNVLSCIILYVVCTVCGQVTSVVLHIQQKLQDNLAIAVMHGLHVH